MGELERNNQGDDQELLDDLLDLREALIRREFDAGLQRLISAHNLLIALGVEGLLPDDRCQWETLLAPIFSANRKEQEDFSLIFKEWTIRRPGRGVSAITSTRQGSETDRRLRWRKLGRRLYLILIPTFRWPDLKSVKSPSFWIFTLTPLIVISLWLVWPRTLTIEGRIISGSDQQPVQSEIVRQGYAPIRSGLDGRFQLETDYRNYTIVGQWWSGNFERLRISSPGYIAGYLPAVTAANLFSTSYTNSGDLQLSKVVKLETRAEKRVEIGLEEWQPSAPFKIPVDYPKLSELLLIISIILSPFIVLQIWYALASILRRAWLQSMPSKTPPRIDELRVAGNEVGLFATHGFRRLLLELRRPRGKKSTEIDPLSTIRATVRAGGMFTPVYAIRRSTPEYILLINQLCLADHQARIGLELYRQMQENDIFVDAWVFDGSPNEVRRLAENRAQSVNLQWLASRYPDHRLLVFSSGRDFFNRYTGELEPWVQEIIQFEHAAILTPEPLSEWRDLEKRLRFNNLPLFTADSVGIEALGIWLNQRVEPRTSKPSSAPSRFPFLINERPLRWVDRASPSKAEIDQLISQLTAFLNQSDIDWLSACAAYPQIKWDLTIRCDYWLHGSDISWGENIAPRLTRLSRLPWFRYGSMPEWLRRVLLARLDPAKRKKLRASIEELLRTAADNPGTSFPLQYVTAERVSLWRRLLKLLERIGQRESFKKRPGREPYRDQVFLNFMYGRQPGSLSVKLPRAIRQWLFREGKVELGYRKSTSLLNAVLLSFLITSYFYGKGAFDWLRVQDESAVVDRSSAPPVIKVSETSDGYQLDLGQGVTLDLVSLSGGTFTMGSDEGDVDEKPPHDVVIKPFNIARTEVTQAQWRAVMGRLPELGFKGAQRPVESVSWYGSMIFCERLSELSGLQVRLPSEAEWEFAARGGTKTKWSFGDDESALEKYAWYAENSGRKTQDTGRKLPNPFGLYDVHGNVWEWCSDLWHDDYRGAPTNGSAWVDGGDPRYRVLRGGSWNYSSISCRSAVRGLSGPGGRNLDVGLRVVVGSRTF